MSKPPLRVAPSYHAHIYFNLSDVADIETLHGRARKELAPGAVVYDIRNRPVGPHHLPMFEIEFSHAAREPVLAWVNAHHGDFSVLLHPSSGNDLEDHRDHAVWLGQPLPLKLDVLT